MNITLRVSLGMLLIGGLAWLALPRVAQRVGAQIITPSKRKPTPTPSPIRRPSAPSYFAEDLGNGGSLEMVGIPGGSFLMGSPDGKGGNPDEYPRHRVTVPDFSIGKYEVTQAQWRAVMGSNPSYFKGDDLPVENVSWNGAKEFCRRLSQMTGKQYRLPTEAEWEYACRAKTTGAYAGNLDAMAWYVYNSGNQTHPVGQKQPNVFGLYDMHGNVLEWCEDDYHNNYNGAPADGRAWIDESGRGSLRVIRGGSLDSLAVICRSAYRYFYSTGDRALNLGFRLVVLLPTPTPTPTPTPRPPPPKIEMVYVPGGSFLMGSPDNESYRGSYEGPQHSVTVPGFSIGKYEVTQAQWRAVMGNNPSFFKGDDLPVENVSWNDAKEFCRRLSQMTGKQYRLPTEAEWEYACRAKTTGAYAGNLDAMAWHGGNSGKKTHPVGQKQPNAFGLYDMHGNVWEWCEDDWHNDYNDAPADGRAWIDGFRTGSDRVIRGCGCGYVAVYCRSADRNHISPDYHDLNLGFRLVRA